MLSQAWVSACHTPVANQPINGRENPVQTRNNAMNSPNPDTFIFRLPSACRARPKGWTLSSTGWPWLSLLTRRRSGSVSWSTFLTLASVPLNEAGWGVNGFRPFAPHKDCPLRDISSDSWGHQCDAFTCQRFFTGKPQDGFPIHIVKL